MAVKKPATKVAQTSKSAAKAASGATVAKAAGKKVAAKSPVASKAVTKPTPTPARAPATAPKKKVASTIDNKPSAKKISTKAAPAAAKKSPAAVAVAKKAVAKKAPTAKSAVAKTTPVAKTASKKVAAPKNVKKAVGKVAAKGAVGKTAVAAIASPSSSAPVKRKLTKVAVAVVGKSQPPVIKNKVKVVSYKTEKNTGRPILPKGYVPSAEEEYMSPLQLEYFRQRLMQWRDDLVDESKQTIENLKEEVRDVGDEAERATRETENSLELRTRDRYRKLISKIDSTLKRVDTGDYGFCVDSGEEIGLERMDARLTAERTIDAQERWEHLRKQMGD